MSLKFDIPGLQSTIELKISGRIMIWKFSHWARQGTEKLDIHRRQVILWDVARICQNTSISRLLERNRFLIYQDFR